MRSNLSRIGYGQRAAEVKQPNRFDTNLASGMKKFQAAKGLKVDGVANPGGPTDRALQKQVGKQQVAVKQAYEAEAVKLKDALGAIGTALAGWRIGQQVAQQQNERRQSIGLPPAAPVSPKADGTIMSGQRTLVDGNATTPPPNPPAANLAALTGKAPSPAAQIQGADDQTTASPDRPKVELAQAKGDARPGPVQERKDPAKPDKDEGGADGAAKPSPDRYTVRHDPNTRWTAKGAIWTPADGQSATKSPAKREIYVGKFLHDKAKERLGLKDARDVDMATVSATVLGMAKAGKTKKEAMAWLETNVIANVGKSRQSKVRAVLGRAVRRTWRAGDKAVGWYHIVSGYTPAAARDRLMAAYNQLIDVARNGRLMLRNSMAADAIEHWLNGSGRQWNVNINWLRKREPFQRADAMERDYFRKWLLTGKSNTLAERFLPRIPNMKVGQIFIVPSKWDRYLSRHGPEIRGKDYAKNADLWAASGQSKISGVSRGLVFKKISGGMNHGIVEVSGDIKFTWEERYNWDRGKITPVPNADPSTMFRRRTGRGLPFVDIVHQSDIVELEKYSNAKNFRMASSWSRKLVARLTIVDNQVVRVDLVWK